MLAIPRFPVLCSLPSTSYIGTFPKRTYAHGGEEVSKAARLAPFLVEKVRFVIPLSAGHAKASAPRLISQFYYESSLYGDGKVNLCERQDLPMIRRNLLDRKLNLNLLEGRDVYLEDSTRYKIPVRRVFDILKWPDWIRAREKVLKRGDLPLESLINGQILTNYDVLKVFFIHPLILKKPRENNEVNHVQIVGQKIGKVYLFYRLIRTNERHFNAGGKLDRFYSGLKLLKEITHVPKEFQEGYPFTSIPYGNFEMKLKTDSTLLPISYFKQIDGVNKDGSTIGTHSQFEFVPQTHAYHVNYLNKLISIMLSASNTYIVGIKNLPSAKSVGEHFRRIKNLSIDKSIGKYILQRVEEHSIFELTTQLQAYFEEKNLLKPGIQFAYEFFAENMKLLDRYPDGYCTMSFFSTQATAFDIDVYKDDNRGLSFRQINEMRKEYGKR